MDSPPLSKLINNVQFADESFGDMSLPSADSPAPPRKGTGFGSLLNRPAPTRNIEETPRVQKHLGGTANRNTAPSLPASTATDRPRYSIFGVNNSLKSSTSSSFGSKRHPEAEAVTEEDDVEEEVEDEEGELEADRTITIDQEQEEQTAAGRAAREERLKDSLYELRGINDTFEMFLGALESARGHNERLARRVNETSTLLDQYTALLGQTAHTHKLLSNPNWTGVQDDVRAIAAERNAEETARIEAIRKAEEAQRLAEEEQERKEEAARAREAAAAAGTGKASTRGRGMPSGRGTSTRGRGSGIPAPTARTASSGKPALSVRQAPNGQGLAGQYANVKSSGYGPSRKAT